MRFRAKIVDINCIQHFTRVLGTISRMAKMCALRMTPTKLYFILADNAAVGGVSIWCELTQSNFFDEYRIEGKDETNNIYLELAPDNLARAMKSAGNAQAVKIKLTKKHTPCLTFEITLPSLTSHTRSVVHDVPVGVIPQRNWEEYEEPAMPDFDVSIYMPSLKVVKNVIERMKNLSSFLILAANQNGDMTLGIDTDLAAVTTHFKHLDMPTWEGDNSSQNHNRDPDKMAEARVDVKKLATFLHGQQVNPSRVICNIMHGKAVQFLLLHEDISLQYVIPAVSL
ncbi:DNA damage checkpoint control protein [Desmophyllum pertusum]|uniref:Checkpoint protein n=1 Tax=Desmophyllum pertusum TaxID=174260 RepID=A0A9W9ZLX7_9CNID|nr:DNA damage checkpoint control protein [Desmophyllum pertusum]